MVVVFLVILVIVVALLVLTVLGAVHILCQPPRGGEGSQPISDFF